MVWIVELVGSWAGGGRRRGADAGALIDTRPAFPCHWRAVMYTWLSNSLAGAGGQRRALNALRCHLDALGLGLSVPVVPSPSCDAAEILCLHQWFSDFCDARFYASAESLMAKQLDFEYGSASSRPMRALFRTGAVQFTQTSATDLTCDIRDVEALSASKSDLKSYSNLDEFAEACCQHLIAHVDELQLHRLLQHSELRILRSSNKGDYFEWRCWDGRVTLTNAGGSHHFAAARYIAGKLRLKVPLSGRLYRHSLVREGVSVLRDGYLMYAVGFPSIDQFFELSELINSTGAEWCARALPLPHRGLSLVLFFPRADKRSLEVASVFHDAKFEEFGERLHVWAHRPHQWSH